MLSYTFHDSYWSTPTLIYKGHFILLGSNIKSINQQLQRKKSCDPFFFFFPFPLNPLIQPYLLKDSISAVLTELNGSFIYIYVCVCVWAV